MKISDKIKMKSTPITQAERNIGIAIEVNGNIAVTVVYDEMLNIVKTNIFHKDIDKAVASSEFLDLDEM